MVGENSRKIAVLIDAENIAPKYVKIVLDEASNYGAIVYKRIYADWSRPSLAAWREVILDYSIQPIQQFSNTRGKNATDSAMIIDAMDLLHNGRLQGFCIVSSDSDFTRLASRLRESEMLVIGMGEQKTPTSFISACDRFQYLDVLYNESQKEKEAAQAEKTKAPEPPAPQEVKTGRDRDEVIKTIGELVDANEDEWMFLGSLGNGLLSRYPDFDARNFGCKKLSDFVQSLDMFETQSKLTDPDGNARMLYIRRKAAPPAPKRRGGTRRKRQ